MSRKTVANSIGSFYCDSCEWNRNFSEDSDLPASYMRCDYCNNRQTRQIGRPVVQESRMTLRLTHQGAFTVDSMEKFASMAKTLGADGSVAVGATGGSYYIDISTDALATRLEIQEIREGIAAPA